MTTIDTISESLPFPSITRHPSITDYAVFNDCHQQLKSKSASIQSELVGKSYSIISLVLPQATYATLTGVGFAASVNPRPTPVIPPGSTSAQISAIERNHKAQIRI